MTNTDTELEELIEKRIQIAANETKSDDEVVQIAWLADGIGVWFRTDGERGNSPEEARRFIISSITRLLNKSQQELIDKIELSLEKRTVTNEKTYDGYDRKNPRHRYTTGVDVGYNHALKEVTTILKQAKERL